MYKTIFIIVWIFVGIIYILSFIISLKVFKNRGNPIRNFFWYTSVAVFVLIIFVLSRFKILTGNFYFYLSAVSLIYHFSFIALFIIKQINFNKKLLKLFYVLFLIFISFLIITDFIVINGFAFLVTSLGLVVFCLYYYLELFNKSPQVNLLKDPVFWIITGVFLGMGLTIPGYAIGSIYLKHNLSDEMYYLIASILMVSYGIMHLFFIKAFSCSLHHKL